MILIDVINPVWSRLQSDDLGVLRELRNYLTFDVPNAKYNPKVKKHVWDGKICLIKAHNNFYTGLIPVIQHFASKNKVVVQINDPSALTAPLAIDKQRFNEVFNEIASSFKHKPRDYQIRSTLFGLSNKRSVIVLPTASGKSLVICMLFKYLQKSTLLIVPTTNLVLQMQSDMLSYGIDASDIQIIMGGLDKQIDNRTKLVISTWQSIVKQPRAWFEQFQFLIVDEVHHAAAKSLIKIAEHCTNAEYRLGTTGSLDNIISNVLTVSGLFGTVKRFVTTRNLIDRGDLAALKIQMIRYNYADSDRKELRARRNALLKQQKLTGEYSPSAIYNNEIEFLLDHPLRRARIVETIKSLRGNTMVLFQRVEKDGVSMVDALQTQTSQKVYFVHGGTVASDREEIRRILEDNNDIILVASVGVFSTGTNIKNLHNVVCVAPTKSQIRVMQSIGRALRMGANKTEALWIDIVDDLTIGKQLNYASKHAVQRLSIYKKEQHDIQFDKQDIW